MSEGNTTIGKKTVCSKVCKKDKCVKKCEKIKDPSKKKIKRICINIGKKPLCNASKDGTPNKSFDVSKIKKGGSAGYFGKRPPRLNQDKEPAKLKASKERPVLFKEAIKKNIPKIRKIQNEYNKISGFGIESTIKHAYTDISREIGSINQFKTHGRGITAEGTKQRNKKIRDLIDKNLKDIEDRKNRFKPKIIQELIKQYEKLRSEVSKYGAIKFIKNDKLRDGLTIYFDGDYDKSKITKQQERLDKKIKLIKAIMTNSLNKSIMNDKENVKKKEDRKKKLTIQQRERRRKAKLKK
tara:strand:+ start:1079 stop:1966 length:888 start_codon:yes stop_codon:yes gene_type:complete